MNELIRPSSGIPCPVSIFKARVFCKDARIIIPYWSLIVLIIWLVIITSLKPSIFPAS